MNRDDILYITINQSKDIWTEKRQYSQKAICSNVNVHLEENYLKFLQNEDEHNSRKKKVRENKYQIDQNRVRLFLFS